LLALSWVAFWELGGMVRIVFKEREGKWKLLLISVVYGERI